MSENIVVRCSCVEFQERDNLRWAVDIMSPDPNAEMTTIDYFETKEEAIKFAKETYGADDEGRICIVSEMPDME